MVGECVSLNALCSAHLVFDLDLSPRRCIMHRLTNEWSADGWAAFQAAALEPEIQPTLHLPGRTAVPAPEHGTGAGVDAHGGVTEIEGGVVDPHLHQGSVIGAR